MFEIPGKAWTWIIILLLVCFLRFLTLQPFAFAFDTTFHLRYTQDFAQALFEGNGLPDWDARPFGGRGAPAFRFYAPAVYVVAALFIGLGFSTCTSLKIAILLFALAGAVGVYRWLTCLGRNEAALFGVLVFLSAPVVAMHLFMIFLMQNACAMFLFPLALDGLTRLALRGNGLVQTILSCALIALTHLPSMLMVGMALLLISITYGLVHRSPRLFLQVCLILALGLGLAGPYVVPAVADLKEIHFERLQRVDPIARKDFLDDFDFSEAPGKGSEVIWSTFRLEYQFILIALLGLGLLGFWLIADLDPHERFIRLFGMVGFVFLFMTTRWSSWLWEVVPKLSILQFPWRFLFPALVLFLPLISVFHGAGPLTGFRRLARGFAWLVLVLFFLLTVVLNLIAGPTKDLPEVLAIHYFYPLEYLPKTCNNGHVNDAGKVREMRAVAGELQITSEKHSFMRSEWDILVPTFRAQLEVVTHFDPCWRFAVDGRETLPLLTNPCGLMALDLPGGVHQITLFRISPPSRRLGWIIFGISLLVLLCWRFLAAGARPEMPLGAPSSS